MNFLKKLSRKEKIGLAVAGLVVLAVFLDKVLIAPISGTFRKLNRGIEVAEKQLARHIDSLNREDQTRAVYKKYMHYVIKAGSDEEETARILAEIEGLARSSGLSLADIKPQSPKNISFYKKYVVELKAEGSMESIVNFLLELNSSPQLLRAEKISLGAETKGSSSLKAVIVVTKIVIP